MPAAAFKDMWETIKQGMPWEGLVKNRAKNGDHYWVRANVTPVVENGAVTGYISVRTKPSRADIDSVSNFYSAINSNTAGKLTVREGQIIDESVLGRLVRLSRGVQSRVVVGFVLVLALMTAQFFVVLGAHSADGGPLSLVSGAILAATVLVSVAAVLGVSSAVRKPLADIRGHLDRFALQDFDAVVVPSEIREFTKITFLLNAVRAHLAFARQEQQELQLLARRQREEALRGMAETVETESNAAVDKVTIHTDAMRGDATDMAHGAQLVSQNAAAVAAASNQALSSAQTVAAAGEELTASIAEISSQVVRATEVTRIAVERGSETSEVLDSMTVEVGQIAEIADLIQSIASKTNLLALNASIEAARAGEAGKGFAVVAEEVKALANQTAASTHKITEQIRSVNAVTQRAVEAVSQIVAKVGEIDQVAGSIAEAMESQALATDEISRSVCETSDASQEVARQIEMVSQEARKTEDKAHHLMEASESVATAIANLKGAVVRAVRTSTEETNRRRYERFNVSLPAQVRESGRTVDAHLIDVSAGGARLESNPSIKTGGRVSIAASSQSWDGKVVGVDAGGVHVQFDHEYAIEPSLLRRG